MSKKLSKVLSLILSLILSVSIFSVCAFAAAPTISVSGGTVTNGNEITVNVTLSSSSNAAGGNFTLQYDSAKLSPVSYTSGSLVSGYTNNCNLSYNNNSIRFTFSGSNAITSSGTLVSIKFKAIATGSASLSFSAYKLYNTSGSSISSSASGNTITVNPVSTTFTLTYNANGGSVSPSSVNVTSGNSTTLPTPTKSFKITYNANGGSGAPSVQSVSVPCKGWSTSSSATSASYNCGASYKPTANTTLYAVWNTVISTSLSSTKPTRSGYTFLGWSTSSTAASSSYIAGGGINVSNNITLYAVWQSVPTCTITYNANGGSVSPSSVNVTSGNSTTLPTPTKSFKITYNANGGSGAPSVQSVSVPCKGWSTSSSATSASYSCGASYKPTGNMTLYAVWNTPVSTSISSTKPTRNGYTFLGWSTNSNATSQSFSAGESVNLSNDVTLYAVWEFYNPTPVSDNIISIRTQELNLDKKEITGGVSTITIDENYLTSNYKIVVSCSSPNALILDTGETANEDSFVLFIDENGVYGTFKVYIRVYDLTKTILYDEEYITVAVRDSVYYETIYLNYKDTYQLKENKMEYSFGSDNTGIATVDASGKIYASGRGDTFVEAIDEIDTNIHLYKVSVSYAWWQWIIIIVLFGWIWY